MRALIDFGLVVLIWLVQLIIYPSFHYVSAFEFQAWHGRYQTLISWFVIPMMFCQVWLVGREALATRSLVDAASALLVAAAWIVTFTLSVPCHRALAQAGKDPAVIDRLVATNWLRTVAWTLVFVLGAWCGSLNGLRVSR